jgi:hypothetical protein
MTTERGVNDTADQPHVSRSRRLEGSERIDLRAKTCLRRRPSRPQRLRLRAGRAPAISVTHSHRGVGGNPLPVPRTGTAGKVPRCPEP